MKRNIFALVFSCIFLLSARETVHAQTTYVEVASDFTFNSIELAPDDTSKKIVFWSASRGNVSLPLIVRVSGPSRTTVKAFGVQVQGVSEEAVGRALRNQRGWYPIRLGTKVNSQGRTSLTIKEKKTAQTLQRTEETLPPFPGEPTADVCLLLDEALIQAQLKVYEEVFGGTWDRARLCAFLNSQSQSPGVEEGTLDDFSPTDLGSGGPFIVDPPANSFDIFSLNPSSDTVQGAGLFQKDNCSSPTMYLALVEVDLTAVRRDEYPEGVRLTVQLKAQKYTGNTASSIKPAGDPVGRYAGKPLVLMSTLFSSDEKISVTSWSKGQPAGTRSVPVRPSDRVFWRGLSLARAPLNGVVGSSRGRSVLLRRSAKKKEGSQDHRLGRQGTFDIASPINAYGVCFQLKRVRQRANGYPS
jgi:hypothetical protein